MINLLIDSIFNAAKAIENMVFKRKYNWDKLFYEINLCNRSKEYPWLHHQCDNEFYFTIPIGLSINDFIKYKIEIATFLKINQNDLKIEYNNTLILIRINKQNETYNYEDYKFDNKKGVPIGIDLDRHNIIYWDYSSPNQCHLLIAGSTGSGKSVCLDVIVNNLIRRKNIDLYIQDTKLIDLYRYKNRCKYYGEGKENIEEVLEDLVKEMNRRYKILRRVDKQFKPIFIIIEELASFNPKLDKEFYRLLGELLSKGRAASIYVILTTQTPYAEILPGVLKSNINTKIGLKTNTKEASKVVCGDYEALMNLKGKGHGKIFTANSVKEIQCFKIEEAPTAATVDAPDDNKKANNH